MNALISVVVPVYNAQGYLSDCLESLTRQTHKDLEILVIDDGSKDESAALCRQWEKKDGRIRLIQKENGGVSSARNLGLEQARGEYVAFVDADDWLLPGMLKEQLALLVKKRGDMILGGYKAVGEAERERFRQGCREGTPDKGRTTGQGKPEADEEPCGLKVQDCQEQDCQAMDAERYVNRFLLQGSSRCWSILFSRKAIGTSRFPEGLSIGEDLVFLARLMPGMKRILVTEGRGYCYFINEKGAMLSEFRPSYMDQITCWELAEKELARFGEEAEENVRLCLFQAALLTAGKLALLEPSDMRRKYGEYLNRCHEAAGRAWRELGGNGRKRLSAGYRVKGMIFLRAPLGYLSLYHIWKRRRFRT